MIIIVSSQSGEITKHMYGAYHSTTKPLPVGVTHYGHEKYPQPLPQPPRFQHVVVSTEPLPVRTVPDRAPRRKLSLSDSIAEIAPRGERKRRLGPVVGWIGLLFIMTLAYLLFSPLLLLFILGDSLTCMCHPRSCGSFWKETKEDRLKAWFQVKQNITLAWNGWSRGEAEDKINTF